MNTSVVEEAILEHARYEIFRHLLLVIVCMIVFGAVGIIGNSFAFAFYAFNSKPSSTVTLIACLAMVDLIVCVEFIPNIIEMWINVRYTSNLMCKLTHFIGLWTVACSGLILWVVAIDRHRKICSPFGKQMTLVMVKYAVVAIIIFGCVMSVRNFANFDSVVVDVKDSKGNTTVKGHYCTTRDDSDYIVSVTIFTVIDFTLMLVVWVTLGVAYSHIIYKINRLKRTRKRTHNITHLNSREMSNPSFVIEEHNECPTHIEKGQDPSKENIDFSKEHCTLWEDIVKGSVNDKSGELVVSKSKITPRYAAGKQILAESLSDSQASTHSHDSVTETGVSTEDSQEFNRSMDDLSVSCDIEILPEIGNSLPKVRGKSTLKRIIRRIKRRKRYNSAKCPVERKLTFKMLVVSLLFIVCFTPYFIVKILMREVLKSGEEYELNLFAQIALRLPYMNSVFNPIVYCVFNSEFRLYILNIFKIFWSKCFSKQKVRSYVP